MKFISDFALNLYKHFKVVFQSSVGWLLGFSFFVVEISLPQVLSINHYISVAECDTREASNILKICCGGKVLFFFLLTVNEPVCRLTVGT